MESDEDIIDDDCLEECYADIVPSKAHEHTEENEATEIERLSKCFMMRYSDCPAFFMGSLKDACEKAFDDNRIKENSPLLIYIHHEQALCTHIFCLNILCSGKLIVHLLDNYIIWPWDITSSSNRDRLIDMWTNVFPNQPIPGFSKEDCPMLIAISKSNEYRIIPLLKHDTLIRLKRRYDLHSTLKELTTFREEFDALSYDYFPGYILGKTIMAEICKYLSLNDAINAFSERILTLLGESDARVHIVEPCENLSGVIHQRLHGEQIVAFCSNTDQSSWKIIADYSRKFHEICSLTLLDLDLLESVSEFEYYFPKLTRLSLRYNNAIDFNRMKTIFRCLPRSIRRFEIHSTRILCSHYNQQTSLNFFESNYQLKSFLLDLDNYPLITREECFAEHPACFLGTLMEFLRAMPRIECFHLIVNRYDLENLIEREEWESLFYRLFYLKKVKLRILGTITDEDVLWEKIEQLRQRFSALKQSLVLKIIVD